MTTAVVVGAGMAGLYAARLLAPRYDKVLVVERRSAPGGLLRSVRYPNGCWFDQGIHYALSANNPDIDAVLFDGLVEGEWHVFTDCLPEGNYFNGRLNTRSGCIDATTLAPEVHSRGLTELLCAPGGNGGCDTLEDSLEATYGATYTDTIYRPVMRKLTGLDLGELAPGAHKVFLITRLIVLPSGPAIEIKRSPVFDDRIAFANTTDGSSTMKKYYPRTGGVGQWIDLMVAKLEAAGVELLLGTTVDAVGHGNGQVTEVSLGDGRTIECDHLVWTVPPILCGRASGIELPSARPKFRHLVLVHLLFDVPVIDELHWVPVYDEEFLTFRVTLYPNITTEAVPSPPHRVTVEVLVDEVGDTDAIAVEIAGELGRIGLVKEGSKAVWSAVDVLPNAYPVSLPGGGAVITSQANILEDELSNLSIFGRSIEGTFGQAAILDGIHRRLGSDG